jgi:hypothetical protein
MASAATAAAPNYRNPEGPFTIKTRTPMNIAPSLQSLSNFRTPQTLFTRNAEKNITPVKANAIAQFRFDGELATAPDGVYTWILKDFIVGPRERHRHLVSAPARTKQEIGSLHVNMDNLTKEGSVIAAGELRKTGATLEYNISSGTYMGDVFVDTVFQTRKSSGGKRIYKKDVITYTTDEEVAAALAVRDQILRAAAATFAALGFGATFLEIAGPLRDQPIANIAGQPILETADIVLANASLFGLYKAGLKEVGWSRGGARKTARRRRHRKTTHARRG